MLFLIECSDGSSAEADTPANAECAFFQLLRDAGTMATTCKITNTVLGKVVWNGNTSFLKKGKS